MPMPADIVEIIEGVNDGEGGTIRAEYKPMQTSPDVNDWQDKTEAEKQDFNEFMKQAKRKLRGV